MVCGAGLHRPRKVRLHHLRVAVIGYDPGYPGIEAVGFGSPATLSEYEGLIWRPAGLLNEYRDAYTQPGDGEEGPLLSLAASARLLSDARRRREDFERHLKRGQVLVVEPCGDRHLRVHAIEDILPFNPEEILPQGMRPGMVPTREAEVAEFRGGQPFRAFVEAAGDCMPARAALERLPGVPLLFGRRDDSVLGGYVYRHPGHLLFLPLPDLADREASRRWHAALRLLVERLGKQNFALDLPGWSDAFLASGERELRQRLSALLTENERLMREIAAHREQLRDLDWRRALFATGGRPLVAAVTRAFQRLEAGVLPGLLGSDSMILEHRGRHAVVLVVDREGEDDAAPRLEALLHRFSSDFFDTAKGIVVHGRALPPDRSDPIDEALNRQLMRNGHCYLTGWDLFGLLCRPSGREASPLPDLFAAVGRPSALVSPGAPMEGGRRPEG